MVVTTRVAASSTAPIALTHDSLSCVERKYARIGYDTWLSSTSAAHRSHSANIGPRPSRIRLIAMVSSSWTPDGGAPARWSSVTTSASRRWNDAKSENRNEIASATTPSPVAPETTAMIRAGGSMAASSAVAQVREELDETLTPEVK